MKKPAKQSVTATNFFSRPDFWAPLLFISVGFLIYSNSFQSSFRFDDYGFIADRMEVRDIGRVWKDGDTLRKIPYLTFALNYSWTGLKVWSWHLVNLLLHLVVTLLVWGLARTTWRSPALTAHPWKKHAEGLSALTALFFLCHPIQTSSVTYIYQRLMVIATLFHVLALYAYAKARIDRKFAMFGLAIVAAILAGFSKQVNISLPLTILLYEAAFCSASFGEFICRWPRYLAYIAGPAAIYLWAFKHNWVQVVFSGGFLNGLRQLYPHNVNSYLAWHQWVPTQLNVIRTYFRLMIFPINQTLDYDYPISNSFSEPGVLVSLLFLAAVLGVAVACWRRYRWITFGLLFILATFIIEFFAIRDVIFEHRMYLPMIGFAFFAPAMVQALSENFQKTKWVCIALLAALSLATFARNAVWTNEEKFWMEDIKHSPLKGRPYYSLGVYYALRGEHDKAAPLYVKAIELWPTFADAYTNLGKSLENIGHMSDAIHYYTKAVELDPTLPDALNNLGSALIREGRHDEARKYYLEAIKYRPDNFETLNNMGTAYAQQKKYDEAYDWYLKSIKANPEYAHAHNNLGSILEIRGDNAGAEKYFKEAIRLRPDFFEAYNNLAAVYTKQQRYPEAIEKYKKALSIQPNYAESNNNLASLLANAGKYEEAERYYLQAIKNKPDYMDVYVSLTNVYLIMHRFSDAEKLLLSAQRLQPDNKAILESQRQVSGQKRLFLAKNS